MNCTNCGVRLTPEAMKAPGCPYCGATLPHEARAAERAEVAKELLADRNQDGVPDALEGLVDATARGAAGGQRPPGYGPPPAPGRPGAAPPGYAGAQPPGYAGAPAGFGPPPGAPARAAPAPARRSGAGPILAAGLGVAVLGMAGAGVFMVSAVGDRATGDIGSSAGNPLSKSAVKGPAQWNTTPAGCAVHANGDAIADHVGTAGDPGKTDTLTVVDGSNGVILHSGRTYPPQSRVHCLSDQWFFVAQKNFQIDFYSSRQLAAPSASVMGRDTVRAFGVGDGCVSIETADGSTSGYALPSGTVKTCDAKDLTPVHQDVPGVIGLTDKETQFRAGNRTYELVKRRQGTPVLTASVSEGSRALWKKELSYQAPTFASAIAAGKGVVLVWAAELGDDDSVVLVGLDESTGQQLYAHKQPGRTANNMEFFAFNGSGVVAEYSVTLRAFEPKSGQPMWNVGRSF